MVDLRDGMWRLANSVSGYVNIYSIKEYPWNSIIYDSDSSCPIDEMSNRIDDLEKEVDRLAAKVRIRLGDDMIEGGSYCCWEWIGNIEDNGRVRSFWIIVFVDYTLFIWNTIIEIVLLSTLNIGTQIEWVWMTISAKLLLVCKIQKFGYNSVWVHTKRCWQR